jgi:hypothetical protein
MVNEMWRRLRRAVHWLVPDVGSLAGLSWAGYGIMPIPSSALGVSSAGEDRGHRDTGPRRPWWLRPGRPALLPMELAGPPPGHPERLAGDQPLSAAERELWAGLDSMDW